MKTERIKVRSLTGEIKEIDVPVKRPVLERPLFSAKKRLERVTKANSMRSPEIPESAMARHKRVRAKHYHADLMRGGK
jgi:hypothetical protein